MPQSTEEKWELHILQLYLKETAASINKYSSLFHAHVSNSGVMPQLKIAKK